MTWQNKMTFTRGTNKFRTRGNTVRIDVSTTKNSGVTTVIDVTDTHLVLDGGGRWSVAKRVTGALYVHGWRNGRCVSLHAWILGLPACGIDHVNMDGLDNRRTNLRLATKRQNAANTGLRADNKSGAKGVFRLGNGRFMASIGISGKTKYLGCFDSLHDAANAYDKEAVERFGAFARTNKELR